MEAEGIPKGNGSMMSTCGVLLFGSPGAGAKDDKRDIEVEASLHLDRNTILERKEIQKVVRAQVATRRRICLARRRLLRWHGFVISGDVKPSTCPHLTLFRACFCRGYIGGNPSNGST